MNFTLFTESACPRSVTTHSPLLLVSSQYMRDKNVDKDAYKALYVVITYPSGFQSLQQWSMAPEAKNCPVQCQSQPQTACNSHLTNQES